MPACLVYVCCCVIFHLGFWLEFLNVFHRYNIGNNNNKKNETSWQVISVFIAQFSCYLRYKIRYSLQIPKYTIIMKKWNSHFNIYVYFKILLVKLRLLNLKKKMLQKYMILQTTWYPTNIHFKFSICVQGSGEPRTKWGGVGWMVERAEVGKLFHIKIKLKSYPF